MSELNLYLVERTDRIYYDEYKGFVIACETEQEALNSHPLQLDDPELYDSLQYELEWWDAEHDGSYEEYNQKRNWTTKNNLKVTKIGSADFGIKGLVLASYRAG